MYDNIFALLATGDELVAGKKINTNTTHIADALYKIYAKVSYHVLCSDSDRELSGVLNWLVASNNIIITGGLGPTNDDITRDVVSNVVNKPLQYSSKAAKITESYLNNKGLTLNEKHHKQFYFPEGSILFENYCGTAWGFASQINDYWIYALPGPPRENQPMLLQCLEHIKSNFMFTKEHRLHWVLKGPEERLVSFVDHLVKQYDVEIHTCTHGGYICDIYFALNASQWNAIQVKKLASDFETAWLANNIDISSSQHSIME